MAKGDWTDIENDLIVSDYFAMLAKDFAGDRYNKAEHNRRLQTLIHRGRGAIEFKHQNISAVLMSLGEAWLPGYKPAFNFQMSLVDVVVRWLTRNREWLIRDTTAPWAFQEAPQLWVGPPPTMSNEPPPEELEKTLHIARKFDVAGRDERNRALGRAGEALVVRHERSVLRSAGREDLSRAVRWVSQEDGDGAGFDILSFSPDGRSRLIEVKTTNGWDRTPFHISRNELAVAEERPSDWRLLRLWNFSREPRAFELAPPLTAHVSLTATAFQATFN
jgi:hypothetical protein